MKIESIIKRKEGTTVTLDGETYHFKPNKQGDHVAEVDEPEHIAVLLAIVEGYRSYDNEELKVESKPIDTLEDAKKWLKQYGVNPRDDKALRGLAKSNDVKLAPRDKADAIVQKLFEALA